MSGQGAQSGMMYPTYVNNINISNNYNPTTFIYHNPNNNLNKNGAGSNQTVKKDLSGMFGQQKKTSNTSISKPNINIIKPAIAATALQKTNSNNKVNDNLMKGSIKNNLNSNINKISLDEKSFNFSAKKRARENSKKKLDKLISLSNEDLFTSESESEYQSDRDFSEASNRTPNININKCKSQIKSKNNNVSTVVNNGSLKSTQIEIQTSLPSSKKKKKSIDDPFILTPCNKSKRAVNVELEIQFKESLNSMNVPKRKKIKGSFDFEDIVRDDNNLSFLSFLDNNDKNSKLMILQNQSKIEKEKAIAYQSIEHNFMRINFPEEYTNENFFLHTMLKHDRQKKVNKYIAHIEPFGKELLNNIKEDGESSCRRYKTCCFSDLPKECMDFNLYLIINYLNLLNHLAKPIQIWRCESSNKYTKEELEIFIKEIKKLWLFQDYLYSEEDILEYLFNNDINFKLVLDQFITLANDLKAEQLTLANDLEENKILYETNVLYKHIKGNNYCLTNLR